MNEEFDKLVAELAENTDRNAHTENLVALANRFECLEKYRKAAQEIQEDHEKQGYMTGAQSYYRDDLVRNSVEIIRKHYGDAVADKVKSAL